MQDNLERRLDDLDERLSKVELEARHALRLAADNERFHLRHLEDHRIARYVAAAGLIAAVAIYLAGLVMRG